LRLENLTGGAGPAPSAAPAGTASIGSLAAPQIPAELWRLGGFAVLVGFAGWARNRSWIPGAARAVIPLRDPRLAGAAAYQVPTELYMVRHYGLALVFFTPLILIMTQWRTSRRRFPTHGPGLETRLGASAGNCLGPAFQEAGPPGRPGT